MLDFVAESWTWFGVVMLAVATRYVSRLVQFKSIRKLPVEDWCMVVVTMLYVAETVLLIKTFVTPTNLLAPDEVLDPATIPLRIYGSKLIVALEQIYCATIWGCKGCLLILYASMVVGSIETMIVKIVACYAAGGYVLMVILYFAAWCRPFYNYWSVPAADPQCSTALHHLITNMVFNVSTDIMMMCIPIPLLVRTNLPLKKKIILVLVFSFGIFGIACAVLNKYYSFTKPYGSEWSYFYMREVSCCVIIANVPYTWALLRRAFNLKSFFDHSHAVNPRAGGPEYARPRPSRTPLSHSFLNSTTLSSPPSPRSPPPPYGVFAFSPKHPKSAFSRSSDDENRHPVGDKDITDASLVDPDPVRFPELAWRKMHPQAAAELLDDEDIEKADRAEDFPLDHRSRGFAPSLQSFEEGFASSSSSSPTFPSKAAS